MGRNHGKGELELYEDGSKEIGEWICDYKQGKFECYDRNGTLTHTKIYKNDQEIECELVKQ